MSGRILVVEDEQAAADYVAKGLREHGYTVETAEDGRDGLYLAASASFDAVVLDRTLPGMDGLSMLKAMRAGGVETPVLILSALGHIDERVKGLRAGGDDYLAKPFGFSELLARLEALMRRRAPGRNEQTRLACGDLEMDLLTRRVCRAGKPIVLLPREFKILEFLLRNADRVVTRTMMLEHVWDYRFDPHSSLIDTHMSRLRRKIDDGFEPPLLHTIRGAGYRLSAQA
ncbi:MAG TPA: response regulator transcription factor [Caulobacterales bacterium]|nr:response regulator transcription factor [Caulobacterales bacterium]